MKQYIITDLHEGLVNITEDQLLEIGGGVSVQESPKDLPKDFFISGWNRGTPSFLMYETDVPNRFFDLRQYVPTMRVVSEILRQPGTNNIICISGNPTDYVTNPMQIIKLIDCKIIDNVFTPSGFEFAEFFLSHKTHGSDIDNEYIYISTRPGSTEYMTIGTEIIKININNFSDYKRLIIEPESGIVGLTTDIIEYNESLYALICDRNGDYSSRLLKINKNLDYYEVLITVKEGLSNAFDSSSPFVIYNDEIIFLGRDRSSGVNGFNSKNHVIINIYSITGQFKRKKVLVLGEFGTTLYQPHWCTVMNNKLIVTPTGGGDVSLNRYIFRADIGSGYDNDSIILEEVTFTTRLVSDDNSLFSNGMLYIGNETMMDTTDSKLIRMPYWDFTQQEVLYSNYSHIASLKIKTPKQTTRPFDTLFYKTKENLPLVGAINILYVVQEGLDKGVYEWYDGVYENLGGSGEIQDVSATESGIVNNNSLQELGGVDKLINGVRVGRGGGDIETNTILGDGMTNNTTGGYNTGAGYGVLENNKTGSYNCAFGTGILLYNTTGSYNTAIGASTLTNNVFGSQNVAIGAGALYANIGVENSNIFGHRSVAIGPSAMVKNTTGNGIGIGNLALGNQTTGMWNIGIGNQAGSGITTGENNIILAGTGFVIGGGGITTGNNNLIIAQNNGNTTGITTGSGNTIVGKVTGLEAGLNNSVHLLNGVGEHAFRMNEDKSIDLPNLTKALINSGSDKSPVTKEWVNPQTTRPLLNTNFNTNDLIDEIPQYGREINLQNTSNIEATVKENTFSTYFKGGVGAIKFVADTGRTLELMDATDTINGIVGSYAKVKSFGTVDYIYINNYE